MFSKKTRVSIPVVDPSYVVPLTLSVAFCTVLGYTLLVDRTAQRVSSPALGFLLLGCTLLAVFCLARCQGWAHFERRGNWLIRYRTPLTLGTYSAVNIVDLDELRVVGEPSGYGVVGRRGDHDVSLCPCWLASEEEAHDVRKSLQLQLRIG